jgi:hypothetical protein
MFTFLATESISSVHTKENNKSNWPLATKIIPNMISAYVATLIYCKHLEVMILLQRKRSLYSDYFNRLERLLP